LGQVPFKTVMIHGLVRDKTGRKFSKSLNNGVDPLDMIAKYGADALRMGLLTGTALGNDIRFDENKVKGYKNFANKIWNITRFILSNYTESDSNIISNDVDQAHLDKLTAIMTDVTKDIEEYRLYMATEKLYHYVWHELADIILEESKPILAGTDEHAKASRQQLLLTLLEKSLIVLHPFMPFITEEIWSMLPDKKELLIVESWPVKTK
jgi:valyl-tRNA synthetase